MKNNHKVAIGILSSTIFFSQATLAAPYVSGQLGVNGYGSNNLIENIFNNKNDIDLAPTGRLSAGYLWDINDCLKLGVEAGASTFRAVNVIESDLLTIKAKRWSADALAVADFFVMPQVDLFAKAGVAYAKQTYPINLLGFQGNTSTHAVVPKGVVGAGFNVTPNVNLNLSLNHEFKKNKGDNFIPGASSILAGVKYSFS